MQQAIQHPVETKTPPHHFMMAGAILLRQYVSSSSTGQIAQEWEICNSKSEVQGDLSKNSENLKSSAWLQLT